MEASGVALTRLFYCEPPNADFAWMGEAHAANFERSEMAECLARGGDPKAEGIAEHGELMGGRGKPQRLLHGGLKPPRHFGFHGGLAPLEWFAHDEAMRRGRIDPQHKFIGLMIADCTAGAASRPTAAEVYESIVSDDPISDDAAGDLRHLLGCMFEDDLPGLIEEEGLSVRQLARAFLRSHCRRHAHMDWINGFARPLDEDAAALRSLRDKGASLPLGPPALLYDPNASWSDDGDGREPTPWFARHLSTAVDAVDENDGGARLCRTAGRLLADMFEAFPAPMHKAFHALDDRLRPENAGSPLAAWRTRLTDFGPRLARLLRGDDAQSARLLPHMPLAGLLSGPERQALREACGVRGRTAKFSNQGKNPPCADLP